LISFRLKTTAETADILKALHNATGITPNILSRIAISLSLNIKAITELVESDNKGIEFNRHTLTGEHDMVYKALIKQHYGNDISEKDYFPDLFNAHLARGVKLLEQEYRYAGNYDKLLDILLGISLDNFEEN